MTYPDGIDALVNVNANDSLAAGGHAARHNSVNTALVEIKNMLGPSPAGKIIQVVRATDSTTRSTTSTSFTDVTGMTVTITPQKSDSAVIILAVSYCTTETNTDDNLLGRLQITDNSNNEISGSNSLFGTNNVTGSGFRFFATPFSLIAYATPATTSAVTYKLRFRSSSASTTTAIENAGITGQMYAIEVSA
jgi:hypothetical protein